MISGSDILKRGIMLRDTKKKRKEDALLAMELAEVNEVANLIFKRLERKIEILEAIEASVDSKIALLEKLLHQAEALKLPTDKINRSHEILSLRDKGLKIDEIASVLDMPLGEVDLILNLSSSSR